MKLTFLLGAVGNPSNTFATNTLVSDSSRKTEHLIHKMNENSSTEINTLLFLKNIFGGKYYSNHVVTHQFIVNL